MKKVIYKFMFSIVFVLLGLIMWPQKQVKALDEEFAPMLIKATYVSFSYIDENESYYEWVVTYKLDNIIIESLDIFEYFFVTERYFSMYHDRFTRQGDSYVVEEIQIEDNSTILYVRMSLSKSRFNQYYVILENSDELFGNESGFYVYYDIYNDGYSDGYSIGYNDGYSYGLIDNHAYDVGYNDGYSDGLRSSEGYSVGYEDGYGDGYEDGKEYGINFGREHWYNVGYQVGYNKGLNEQIADRDFAYLLRSAFVAIGTFLGINLLPGISIGAIIAVPIVFGIIAFILGKRKD